MLELEKGFESVNKTFRIPVNMVEQLDRLAGEYNTSMNTRLPSKYYESSGASAQLNP